MQTFKKILGSVIAFLLVFVLFSSIIVEPMIQNGWYYYCDGKFRKESAGSYQLLFMGSSDGQAAFVPSVFESNTGIKSYNLSGANNTFQSEYYILEQEIERNNVSDVVLQIDYETFSVDYNGAHRDGNAVTVVRTNNVFERLSFLLKQTQFSEWQDIASRLLMYGALSWERKITKDSSSDFVPTNYGWHSLESNNISLSKQEAVELYNTEKIDVNFRNERIDEFSGLIELCDNNNINVIVIMVPIADCYIWKKDNWDELNGKISNVCKDNGVSYIDFNLLKNRFELFNDKESFKDSVHTSESGAFTLTNVLSDVYEKTKNGESIDDLFYSSYEEMKQHSPYYAYL